MLKEFSLQEFERLKSNLPNNQIQLKYSFIERYTNIHGLKMYLFGQIGGKIEKYIEHYKIFIAFPKYYNDSLPSVPGMQFKFTLNETLFPELVNAENLEKYLFSYGFKVFVEWLNDNSFTDYSKIGQEKGSYKVDFDNMKHDLQYKNGNMYIPPYFTEEDEERLVNIGEVELVKAYNRAKKTLSLSDIEINEICFIPKNLTDFSFRMINERGFIKNGQITSKGVDFIKSIDTNISQSPQINKETAENVLFIPLQLHNKAKGTLHLTLNTDTINEVMWNFNESKLIRLTDRDILRCIEILEKTVRSKNLEISISGKLNEMQINFLSQLQSPLFSKYLPKVDSTKNKKGIYKTALGEYYKIEQIGQGGQGIVFEVKEDDKIYALKEIDLSRCSRKALKRIRNEISLCKDYIHEYIIRIIDYGFDENENKIFYIMNKYDSTLRRLMADNGNHYGKLEIYLKVLKGLQVVHNLKITHRDIKPENILIDTQNSIPIICDFGIAHINEELLATSVRTENEKLANFPYAAPEQREVGAEKDWRCDIFAMGIILNEMFTQKKAHGNGYKEIGSVIPGLKKLDRIVHKMLQQAPENRPQSCDEIIKEIELILNEMPLN